MRLESYRQYLQHEFERRKARNPFYSLRAYARDLGASPSRLSEAMSGKRGVSSELAARWSTHLQLEDIDADIFRLSVEAEHARSRVQKQKAKSDLELLLSASEVDSLRTFTVVDWVTEAVLKMSEREPVADFSERTASKLGIPQFMVVSGLRFLTRLGLVRGSKRFKTYLENRGTGRRLNVDYVQILEQAQKAYLSSQNHNEHFTHQAFLLEPKDLARARQLVNKCFAEIKRLEKRSRTSKVVFIANQIFNVEKREGEL